MIRRDPTRAAFRRVLLALALVALVFRIAAPPGTMVADTGHGAALVICTGHGPMTGMVSSSKAPASRTHDNGSCEFAAAAAHFLVSKAPLLLGSSSWTATTLPEAAGLPAVGSGLAAPPPPSHAPPILSV